MGCCSSREASGNQQNNNPYIPGAQNPNAAPDSSSRNITAASPHGSQSSQAQLPGPSSLTPNKRLKPIDPNRRVPLPQNLVSPLSSPLSDSPQSARWTQKRLDKERGDWWDTRVTGNPDIWRAYRLMVEQLQRGDIASAQTLLDATGCTCPSGELWRTIYDESGVKYAVRTDLWIVFEPDGIVDEEEGKSEGEDEDESVMGAKGKETAVEKGKGKATEMFKVKCRLSTNGQDFCVEMYKGEKVGSMVRKLKEIAGLENKRIKISYLGHLYSDNDTLARWKQGHVLNALVFDDPVFDEPS